MPASILLMLDLQNDLVHPDCPNGKSPLGAQVHARQVVARASASIANARAAGMPVGFVRVGFSDDYRECPPHSPVFSVAPKMGLFKLSAWGGALHPDLDAHPGDWQIIKHRVSPFYGTDLDLLLRNYGISRIACCGVSTQAVAQATVRDGHDRDFEMVVLEDCCAAHSAQEHANSIGSLQRFSQVMTSNDPWLAPA